MIALDTNILIYTAATEDQSGRHISALDLIERLAAFGAIVPLQVIGEFLNVCRRKKIIPAERAVKRAHEFIAGFSCPQTYEFDVIEAMQLADGKLLQYFDALIITVAARAGATLLLSEDMQDGLEIEGLRIVNPFSAANAAVIDEYLGPAV